MSDDAGPQRAVAGEEGSEVVGDVVNFFEEVHVTFSENRVETEGVGGGGGGALLLLPLLSYSRDRSRVVLLLSLMATAVGHFCRLLHAIVVGGRCCVCVLYAVCLSWPLDSIAGRRRPTNHLLGTGDHSRGEEKSGDAADDGHVDSKRSAVEKNDVKGSTKYHVKRGKRKHQHEPEADGGEAGGEEEGQCVDIAAAESECINEVELLLLLLLLLLIVEVVVVVPSASFSPILFAAIVVVAVSSSTGGNEGPAEDKGGVGSLHAKCGIDSVVVVGEKYSLLFL